MSQTDAAPVEDLIKGFTTLAKRFEKGIDSNNAISVVLHSQVHGDNNLIPNLSLSPINGKELVKYCTGPSTDPRLYPVNDGEPAVDAESFNATPGVEVIAANGNECIAFQPRERKLMFYSTPGISERECAQAIGAWEVLATKAGGLLRKMPQELKSIVWKEWRQGDSGLEQGSQDALPSAMLLLND